MWVRAGGARLGWEERGRREGGVEEDMHPADARGRIRDVIMKMGDMLRGFAQLEESTRTEKRPRQRIGLGTSIPAWWGLRVSETPGGSIMSRGSLKMTIVLRGSWRAAASQDNKRTIVFRNNDNAPRSLGTSNPLRLMTAPLGDDRNSNHDRQRCRRYSPPRRPSTQPHMGTMVSPFNPTNSVVMVYDTARATSRLNLVVESRMYDIITGTETWNYLTPSRGLSTDTAPHREWSRYKGDDHDGQWLYRQ
ncbi:hypothetical protein BD779DRAFT_1477138 [Infundibulicybe gibba]|nr:hypothetical protein BD779DRAFT_1477138 [Infundibulicybe gibba]